ncbi:hypothetical protein [Alkalihalobacillus sp. LMS39]|uniref:hypothetical protein n=1 Tax=Alkalihalobacillus sp. LMS39 TaxID=2924032 RepID=UPI001FB43D6D|nr:hypothetical protein [Alkalihalobacillus sp. LMS39]UOE93332.1 hypothetical protein MM271_19370 [Alkalihalobacillus sp. LMS39]
MPRRKFRPPLWLVRFRQVIYQCIFYIVCFQFIRTLLLPTTFDVILLTILVIIYGLFLLGVI